MKLRGAHRFGVLALYLLAHLGLGACSSSQEQQGEEVETSEEGGNENAAEGGEEGNSAENAGAEGGEEGEVATNEMVENGAGEEVAEQGNQTGGDLQEIISEMNNEGGNQVPAAQGEAVAEAAPVEEVPAEAPVEAPAEVAAPMNTAAATDASAAPAPAAAPATPAGNGLPEMNSKMPYIVQPGDTLGLIAKKIYGDVSMWTDIKTLTNMVNQNRIYPGDVVYYRLTEGSMAFATAYESQPKSEHMVAAGDTLASIARGMGQANAWRTIWRLNDQVNNPDELTVGQPVVHYTNVTGQTAEKSVSKSVKVAKAKTQQQDVSGFEVNFLAFASLISANIAG